VVAPAGEGVGDALGASSLPPLPLTTEAVEGMGACTLMVVSSSLALVTGSSQDGVDGCDGGDGGVAAAGSAAVEVAASDAGAPDVQYNSGATLES
jgi:hypothetical protein